MSRGECWGYWWHKGGSDKWIDWSQKTWQEAFELVLTDGKEFLRKGSEEKAFHKQEISRSRGVIYHVPLGGTVSLVSSEVGAQMDVLQDVRQRRNSWWGTLNALPRTLGFVLKAMEDEWRVLRRRAITVRFRKITWTYSKENGLHVGNCQQGDQTRDYCKIISKKWGERTHKQW